jgi:hypothetical protein
MGRGGGADESKLTPERGATQATSLESVLQGELNGAVVVDGARDLPKITVGHAAVRLTVIGDVEGIEEVSSEVEPMLMVDGKTLEHGHVDVLETRPAE